MNTRSVAYQLVLERHARMGNNGRPRYCVPSQAELLSGKRKETAGSDGKIIFKSKKDAVKAAEEFEELGADPQRAYPCRRSKNGHHHLTRRLD